MSDHFYYLDTANQRIGPISWEVLMQLRTRSTVDDTTLVASESEPEWKPLAHWQGQGGEPSAELPGETPASNPSPGRKRKPKKEVGKFERIVIRFILGFIAFLILFAIFLNSPLADLPILHQPVTGGSSFHPEKKSLSEVATAIESMPQAHHRIPGAGGENNGVMLLFTGENSVQIRAIPDHPGLYQIDVTRYGVAYDQLPSDPGTRNAMTLVLHLGTEFKDRSWNLVDAQGGAVDQVTKPGQSHHEQKTRESIPREEAMWHGRLVVDFLNGETPNPKIENENASRYRFLEESFLQEHQKIEGIRAQGIRLPD